MKSVLIVDDLEIFRVEFRLPLEAVGYDVEVASSGCEALAKTREKSFDGVTFDTTLLDVDLESFTRTIRGRDARPPVILPALPIYEPRIYRRLRLQRFHPIIIKANFRPHRFAQLVERALEPYRASDDLDRLSVLIHRFLGRREAEAKHELEASIESVLREDLGLNGNPGATGTAAAPEAKSTTAMEHDQLVQRLAQAGIDFTGATD